MMHRNAERSTRYTLHRSGSLHTYDVTRCMNTSNDTIVASGCGSSHGALYIQAMQTCSSTENVGATEITLRSRTRMYFIAEICDLSHITPYDVKQKRQQASNARVTPYDR